MNTKQYVALRDVITKYHPMFVGDKTLQKNALKYSEAFDVEYLMEQTLGIVGNLEHNPSGHGYDYELDKSDCKFVSFISYKDKRVSENYTGYRILIGNVSSPSNKLKQGSLRVVVFDSLNDKLLYYFLPKHFWSTHVQSTTKNQGRLMYNYSNKSSEFSKIEQFRCKTFEELAMKRDEN